MHEMSLMNDLMKKIDTLASDQGAQRVVGVHVWLGALSHMSPDHFREHFNESARGTQSEGAKLWIETSDDIHDANAQSILLRTIEVDD